MQVLDIEQLSDAISALCPVHPATADLVAEAIAEEYGVHGAYDFEGSDDRVLLVHDTDGATCQNNTANSNVVTLLENRIVELEVQLERRDNQIKSQADRLTRVLQRNSELEGELVMGDKTYLSNLEASHAQQADTIGDLIGRLKSARDDCAELHRRNAELQESREQVGRNLKSVTTENEPRDRIARAIWSHEAVKPGVSAEVHPDCYGMAQAVIDELGLKYEEVEA